MNEDNKKPLNPKREALIILSKQAEGFRTEKIKQSLNENEALFWSSKTLNYIMLKHLYTVHGAEEFNTFNQWKEKGATILKGSKAFTIWGQPIRAKEQEKPKEKTESDTADDYKYFPLCFLFSDKQVLFPVLKENEFNQEQPEVFETVMLDEIL
jgi:hypothetical protein